MNSHGLGILVYIVMNDVKSLKLLFRIYGVFVSYLNPVCMCVYQLHQGLDYLLTERERVIYIVQTIGQ